MSKSNDASLPSTPSPVNRTIRIKPCPGLRSIYASPIAANGFLYVVSREGTVLVLKVRAEI